MKLPPLFTRASWERKRHALIDEAAERARALRLLSVDASMEALSSEARSLVTDCANEVWALSFAPPVAREDRFRSMGSLLDGCEVPDSIALDGEQLFALDDRALDEECAAQREREPRALLTRSMRDACARWSAARDRSAPRTPLAMAKARLDQALFSHPGLSIALHAALRAPYASDAQREGTRMTAGITPYSASVHECIVDDLLWRLAFESPSPFSAQLRLWERGAWPVWTEDRTLIVFVSVRGEDGRPMSEERDERIAPPRMSELLVGEPCALIDQPPCALDELVVFARGAAPIRYALDRRAEVVEVGRSRECAIAIPQDTVARRHCLLRCASSSWTVRDTNSTSGTFLDRELIRGERALFGGEILHAGRVWLWFIGSGG
ncbi:MAG: FHA domain-containing protein [Polyangiales bacterium]